MYDSRMKTKTDPIELFYDTINRKLQFFQNDGSKYGKLVKQIDQEPIYAYAILEHGWYGSDCIIKGIIHDNIFVAIAYLHICCIKIETEYSMLINDPSMGIPFKVANPYELNWKLLNTKPDRFDLGFKYSLTQAWTNVGNYEIDQIIPLSPELKQRMQQKEELQLM